MTQFLCNNTAFLIFIYSHTTTDTVNGIFPASSATEFHNLVSFPDQWQQCHTVTVLSK